MTPDQLAEPVVAGVNALLAAGTGEQHCAAEAALRAAVARLVIPVCSAQDCTQNADLAHCEECGLVTCRVHLTPVNNPYYPNEDFDCGVVSKRCPACIDKPFRVPPVPVPSEE